MIQLLTQVDWSKMTEDSASVADKIKKKLHIQSKSGLEKFQVIFIGILLMIVVVMSGIWSLW